MLNEAIAKMPEVFESKILLRGQEYFHRGHVLNTRLSDGLLKGRVKGSSSQIYDVHMDLKAWPAQSARCTCPYQLNCKHAAACLFALHEREYTPDPNQPSERLDRKLDLWLKNLRAQEEVTIQRYEPTHHLVYLIDLRLKGHEHKIAIELALAKQLKRGGYGKKVVFNTLSDSKKQHFIDNDNEIVAQLMFKCGLSGWFDVLTIRNSDLLEQMITTGRAFFKYNDSEPIRLGTPQTAYCQWILHPNGTQSLQLLSAMPLVQPLLIDTSWYFDQSQHVLGHLNTEYPVPQLKHLLEAPAISLEQAQLLANKMSQIASEFPSPQVFTQHVELNETPIAHLILDVLSEAPAEDFWSSSHEEHSNSLFIARVGFEYGNIRITPDDPCDKVVHQQEAILYSALRDKTFEHLRVDDLKTILSCRTMTPWETHFWGIKDKSTWVLESIYQLSDLDYLYSHVIPELKAKGWKVDMASSVYQELINEEDLEWFSDLHEQGTDFFSYQLGILVDGKAVSIVPLVADLIRKYSAVELEQLDEDELVKLPLTAGRMLQMKLGRIKPLIHLLLQFGLKQMDEQDALKINKYQFLLLQEAELALAAIKARWQGAEALRQELKQLVLLKQLPEIPIPKGLKTELRDYQHFGLNWLQFLRSCRFSGVLADDMGLGKTVQTLAHLQHEKEQGRMKRPTLIVAPTSLVGNWLAEANRFTPELRVRVYHGTDRHNIVLEEHDLIISTYGLVHRDKEKFTNYHFYYLILDEAQFIKNAKTKTTHIIQQLKADHRLCLTGTPLENHLGELWSLFHFLMPGLLGDSKQFRTWFRTPIEKFGDAERKITLAARVKPFMLRRAKNEVARELPPKTEMRRLIELEGTQRDVYEAIRMSMEKKVRDAIAKQGLGKSHIVLLDALLKLRQVCCDPRLLSLPQAVVAQGNSAKLEALMELLENLVEEGRRVLVFSQFTSMLQLIEQELVEKKYDYLKLTGQTQNRQALVDQFQQGTMPIFLISLKAGGTGLNLTKADTVIHYDPWWNPAVEDQATDRTHRIGQENPVFVYKLIASGTVEEAILTMQERKRRLVEGVLSSDSAKSIELSEADLQQFFMPLS